MDDAERVVRALWAAFSTRDGEAFRPFLSGDVYYHNIPMDPIVGIDNAVSFLDRFFATCEEMAIDIVHLAVRGGVVLTERVDQFTVGGRSAPLPVMGTFEVIDGKVAAWRDYFDVSQMTKLLSRED